MFLDSKYNEINYIVPEYLDGVQLKTVLLSHIMISSHLMKKLKSNKSILVNGVNTRVIDCLKMGDYISLDISETTNISAENIDIDIVYEDVDVLVINKPPFMVVHPTLKHKDGTLLNAVVNYLHSKGEFVKPHLVNRLDRDTSGAIIIAKNAYAHSVLNQKMSENRMKKKYIALVEGQFTQKNGVIDLPIGRENMEGIKRIVRDDGKISKTRFKLIKKTKDFSLVELELITGRTHQIRVHLSHLGYPIVGDELYGSKYLNLLNRQALHSSFIKFESPRKGLVTASAKIPMDIEKLIEDNL